MCKGRDILRTYISTTCIGAYYLENLDAIKEKCKFDLIEAQEHVANILPVDFPTTIKCPNTFTSITVRSSSQIAVPPEHQVDHRLHNIQPDSPITDSDLETIRMSGHGTPMSFVQSTICRNLNKQLYF
jgi:hypothetical protein